MWPDVRMYRGTADMYMGDAMAGQVVVRAMFRTKIMDEVHLLRAAP